MPRPDLNFSASWEEYKLTLLQIIEEALALLRHDHRAGMSENEINRILWQCFRRVVHKHKLTYHLPVPEGCNPPNADDVHRAAREFKRPDFYWQIADDTADDAETCDRRFVLECKRLGTAASAWVFNTNYSLNGILRFVTDDHGYGKGDDTGGMVGYVQNMDFADILREVNAAASLVGIPVISAPPGGWQPGGMSQLIHILTRPFRPTSYELSHFWIDLR
jgi:hypothetical protein